MRASPQNVVCFVGTTKLVFNSTKISQPTTATICFRLLLFGWRLCRHLHLGVCGSLVQPLETRQHSRPLEVRAYRHTPLSVYLRLVATSRVNGNYTLNRLLRFIHFNHHLDLFSFLAFSHSDDSVFISHSWRSLLTLQFLLSLAVSRWCLKQYQSMPLVPCLLPPHRPSSHWTRRRNKMKWKMFHVQFLLPSDTCKSWATVSNGELAWKSWANKCDGWRRCNQENQIRTHCIWCRPSSFHSRVCVLCVSTIWGVLCLCDTINLQ